MHGAESLPSESESALNQNIGAPELWRIFLSRRAISSLADGMPFAICFDRVEWILRTCCSAWDSISAARDSAIHRPLCLRCHFTAVHTQLDSAFLGQRTALALAFEKCSLSRLDELGDALLAKP